LYKPEVFELAKTLGLPASVIEKKPTADLWEGQSDEDELGISYATLDEILYGYFELGKSETELENFGIENVKKVLKLYNLSEFKRKMPPILE